MTQSQIDLIQSIGIIGLCLVTALNVMRLNLHSDIIRTFFETFKSQERINISIAEVFAKMFGRPFDLKNTKKH